MGEQEPNFTTCKQRGEWVEMVFMARASREGLQVSKPYGESAAYDFIVESGALCSRVQVKSTRARSWNGYKCYLHASMGRRYKSGSFDYAGIYVIPANAWFIVPHVGLPGSLFLLPGTVGSKYYEYEETWHLLKPAEQSSPQLSVRNGD